MGVPEAQAKEEMRLLITGASGFLGSHLVDAAIKHLPDAEIVALAHYRSDGSTGWCPRHSRVKLVRGDIRDIGLLRKQEPTHIINAAAQVSVPDSMDRPESCWDVNCTAVARMLMEFRGVRFIQISTSEVFDGTFPPYKQDSQLCPITPYGASKASAEQACRSFGGTVCRIFNMFGLRQFPRAVIPRMCRDALAVQCGRRDRAELYGPVGSRAFLFAPWVAEQVVTKVLKDQKPVVQLASAQVKEIKWLWEMIASIVGIDPAKVVWNPPPANASPVAKLWGFSSQGYDTPEFDLDALRATVEWYAGAPVFCSQETYE